MRIVCVMVGVVAALSIVSTSDADIIKLKSGVSFEGQVLEESVDAYTVQLQVGVVIFPKEKVDAIEFYSDVQNMQMKKEWEEADVLMAKGDEGDGSDLEEYVLRDEDKNEDVSILSPEEEKEDMVKYKGKYISPEVYDIIQKEKKVKERRYQFLQEQKRKQEEEAEAERRQKLIERTDVFRKTDDEATIQTEALPESSFREHAFGAKDVSAYGEKSSKQPSYKKIEDSTLGYLNKENTL